MPDYGEIKKQVLRQLEINPKISLKDCQKVVEGLKKDNFYKIKRERKPKNKRSKQKRSESITKGKTNTYSSTPDDESDHLYIDDPDELLMSVSKRMLNMPNPDPRWATILLNCRKEKITTKNEMSEVLQKATTRSLVQLLKRKSQEESS